MKVLVDLCRILDSISIDDGGGAVVGSWVVGWHVRNNNPPSFPMRIRINSVMPTSSIRHSVWFVPPIVEQSLAETHLCVLVLRNLCINSQLTRWHKCRPTSR